MPGLAAFMRRAATILLWWDAATAGVFAADWKPMGVLAASLVGAVLVTLINVWLREEADARYRRG